MSEVYAAADAALAAGSAVGIRSALASVRALHAESHLPSLRVSIARTFTIEPQIDALNLALATLPSSPELRIGDFGSVELELLSPTSALLDPAPDAVVVLWRLEDLHPALVFAADSLAPLDRSQAIEDLCERVTSLCRGFLQASTAPLFLSTFPMPQTVPLHDATMPHSIHDAVSLANQRILELSRESPRVFVFDFARWAMQFGERAFDPKMDFFARQPISRDALPSFSRCLARHLRPLLYPAAKVLALDLDNVLWGGILGESGPHEVQVGSEFPGTVYWRIQQRALDLKGRGTLLALTSKNDLPEVAAAFEARSEMPLHLSDFAAIRVNWAPKHENLISIADELNVGLNAFVFVDDQAFEREEVAFHLPEVRILNSSEDPLAILSALERTEWFDSLRLTQADLTRAADYSAQVQRRAPAGTADLSTFLRSLELRAKVARIDQTTMGRAVQMLQKTNQFNLTTIRHGEAALQTFVRDPHNIALTISLRDTFGDQGIIGLVLVAVDLSHGHATIDSFLLSCRAIGRGAEDVLWAEVLIRLERAGVRTLQGTYAPTPKNGQVRQLLDRFGMQLDREEAGARTYRLTLPQPAHFPDWMIIDRE